MKVRKIREGGNTLARMNMRVRDNAPVSGCGNCGKLQPERNEKGKVKRELLVVWKGSLYESSIGKGSGWWVSNVSGSRVELY